jgi:hypothetical protein
MGMVHTIHPRMGSADASGAATLKAPSLFARNYGRATPPGVMMTHIAYGLVLGLLQDLVVRQPDHGDLCRGPWTAQSDVCHDRAQKTSSAPCPQCLAQLTGTG